MPSAFTVTTSWFCSDGGGVPCTSTFGGTSTSSPICRIGVATMKMMSSTSTTSTSGVMLISDRTPWPEPADMDIRYLSSLSLRDLFSRHLVFGQERHGREVGVVRGFHHHAHLAEVDALVGFHHHV